MNTSFLKYVKILLARNFLFQSYINLIQIGKEEIIQQGQPIQNWFSGDKKHRNRDKIPRKSQNQVTIL